MTWTLAAVMTVAMAMSAPGRVGGLRIDAEPGLCEPGDPWTLTGHIATIVRPDGSTTTRGSTGKFSTLPPTCQRELGGLMPGPYRVLVTPPGAQLPPYSFSFEVRPRQWTDISLRLPPVVVRGRVTSNGVPVPGVAVGLSPLPGTSVAMANPRQLPSAFVSMPTDTDNEGRYAKVVWTPGTYIQSFKLDGQELGVAQREVALGAGLNTNDVEVGAGGLRVWFTERGATLQDEVTVRLTMQALPQKPFNRVVRAGATAVEVGMLAPGNYIVRATAERRSEDGRVVSLVSAREAEVRVSANLPTDVSIDLVSREGWLEVFDTDGRPIEGASVVSYPGAASLRTDEAGRVSLSTLPVGARIPIRTRTWGMTCHVVTDDLQQRVTIADASELVVVRIPQGPAGVRPMATTIARQEVAGSTVTGLAGAACPLPFEAFSVAEARVPGAVELSLMLPPGAYTLTLRDGRTFNFRAPSVVEIKK
jgi:hypothetical protein